MTTTKLSDSLTISKVLIGLWQVADLERNNQKLDPLVAAKALHSYYAVSYTHLTLPTNREV